ncbi:glycoside hydrolase family 2 protein [Lacinutrix sp. MEBiC02595]
MKYLKIVLLLVVVVITFQFCKEVNVVEEAAINEDWKFSKVEESKDLDSKIHTVDFNDSAWETISLPHTANIEPLTVNDQWQGICWYRKTLSIPESNIDKKIFLELEAAMNYSKMYINGIEVNEHQGGYLPVIVDISKYVKIGEKNVIAIRLDNTDNLVTGPKPLKRLDFNMYGGLYRKANLFTKDKIYISNPILANKVAGGGIFITYPKVSKKESVVNIKTHLINEYKDSKSIELVQTILRNGKVVEETTSSDLNIEAEKDLELSKQITIVNAELWSPKHPNLYSLETKVMHNGKVIDQQTTRFGIREFTFDNEHKLHINGGKTFLRGVNRHQEYPFIGYALSDNAQYRDAKKIKDGGFDYVRLSHYPQSPAFMDACDELGLVVMDAIMGWQFYNDTDDFRNYCYKSARNLVRRDRNHPSVIGWEVSLNETKEMPVYFMEGLHNIAHEEYPGKNVYSCGWKDDVYDIYLEARQHRILRPHPYKDMPVTVSEYGDWEYHSKNAGLNQDELANDMRVEMSSRQARGFGEERMNRQAYNVQEAHNDNLSINRHYSDSYWVMYDYNRGYHDDIERSGLMDLFRLPKFAYYFYQSQRDISENGAMLELATYWNEKSSNQIKVYSNAEEVELYVNDNLIATQKPDTDINSTNLQHPPFTFNLKQFVPGTLKAIGLVDGKKVVEDIVKTPKKATKLKVWLDQSGKAPTAGQSDTMFLYVAAIDNNDTVNPEFSETITLNIEGKAKVMNLGSLKAEAGIATAVLKLGNKKQNISVSASSGDLKGHLEFSIE